MYLEVISIKGFKSFAGKTVLKLADDFTAIVGPNGSGKSNIAEAIRWVLGEQSIKSLRGERMEDIIFQGTASQAAAPYAEVQLKFNNADRSLRLEQDEVTISRRYTRQGDSRYTLNGKTCRLKDITQLLWDTGIGRDSYSMISQGQVERVLTQRPEQRRQIFEEIAGVMVYKNRKKEAELKLQQAEANLLRLEDILSEVSQQVKTLKVQHDEALLYQESKNELERLDKALTTVQIETAKEQWELVHKQVRGQEEALTNINVERQALDEALSTGKGDLKAINATLADQQERYLSMNQARQHLEGDYRVASEKRHHMRLEQKQLAKAKEALEEKAAQVHSAQVEWQKNLEQLLDKLAELSQQEKELQEKRTRLSSNQSLDVESLRDHYIEELQQLSQIKNDRQTCRQEQKHLDAIIARYSQQQDDLQAKLTAAKKTLQDDQEQMKHDEGEIKNLRSQQKRLARQYEAEQLKGRQVAEKEQEKQKLLFQQEAELKSLKKAEEQGQGLYYGVRQILKVKAQFPGIHGLVADIISVQPKHALAVETALGSRQQQLVVDSDRLAQSLITYLKREKAGRATFLPLNIIKGRSLSPNTLKMAAQCPGYLGVLADLVTYEPLYEDIVKSLLNTTILVQDLTSGRAIARQLGHRQKLVTLAGDVFNPGGAMTGGGKNRHDPALLQRQQNFRQLKQAYENTLGRAQELKEKCLQHEKHCEDLKQQGENVQAALLKHQQSLEKGQEHLAALTERLEDLERESKLLQLDQKEAQADWQTKQDQASLLAKEENGQVKKVEEIKGQIASFNEEAKKHAQASKEVEEAYQACRQELAILSERREHSQGQNEQLTKEKAEIMASLKENKTKAETKSQQLHELQAELENFQQELQAKTSQLKTLEEKQTQLLEKENAQNETLQAQERKREELAHQAQEIRDRKNQLAQQLTRYEVVMDNLLAYLNETYELTFERAQDKHPLELSVPAARDKIKRLKGQLERVGAINLAAIEEYETLKAREDFLETQRADAKTAKANVLKTMADLDQEVAERFTQTFKQVRTAFQDVFPALFGGGEADLKLTDEEEPLTTGVAIIARPPGKKKQLLSLLSGGEKALTAIALLFAILKVKPVPFVVLDEVEAALDEANVYRYGEYLKNYRDKAQFIVITHRKGTMVAASVLYGVTMQEAGVSTIVSVHLEDFEALFTEE